MGALDHSFATLRLFGDDLVPEAISALLGAQPSAAVSKGETVGIGGDGATRIAKTGSWRLRATNREPEDLEAQVFEILDQLSADPSIWQSLARYEPDLFCGLFMRSGNDGLGLSPKALLALGQRGIELILDIYDPVDEADSVQGPP